jgi:ATP adenylyltransferase
MEQIWAPWRGEFVNQKPHEGCIFCHFPAEEGVEADRRNLILGRSAHSFAILNKYPYNNGHLMVIPRRHIAELSAVPAEEYADLNLLLQRSVDILGRVYLPAGYNIGMNLGRVAGAGIADHLHWHIVPRWGGDTNFMPVLTGTKVMIEHLLQSYDKLKPEFEKLA